jgi:hypothetical protein
MAQLFKRRANAIARTALVGGFLAFGGTCAGMFVFGRSDFWTRTEAPLDQPVPFSHEHHVAGLGIDCRYCHTSVEESPFAGLPPTETCMTCHSQIWKDAPVLRPVRDSLLAGKPLRWTRVYDLPDYVFFDHSIHINKGIGCASCHGRIDRMPITWQVQPLYMRWCLECHRNPEKNLRPKSEVFDVDYNSRQKNADVRSSELARQNHVTQAGLTDCYTCHR